VVLHFIAGQIDVYSYSFFAVNEIMYLKRIVKMEHMNPTPLLIRVINIENTSSV